jgi:hypothetical protein
LKRDNSYSEFDELIREKLGDTTEVPESLLWKRLQDQMRYKDEIRRARKRFVFMLSSLLGVIFVGTLTVIMNWPANQGQTVVHAKSTDQKLELPASNTKLNKQNESAISATTTFSSSSSSFGDNPVEVQQEINSTPLIGQELFSAGFKTETPIQDVNNDVSHLQPYTVPTTDVISPTEIPSNLEVITEEQLENSEANVFSVNIEPQTTNDVVNSAAENEPELATVPTENEVRILPVKPALGLTSGPRSSKLSLWMNLNPAYSYRTVADKGSASGLSIAHFNNAEQGKTNFNLGLGASYSLNSFISVRTGIQLTSYHSNYAVMNLTVPVDTAMNSVGFESVYGTYALSGNDFHHKTQFEPGEGEFNQEDSTTLCLTFTNEQFVRIVQVPVSMEFGLQQGKLRYVAGAGIIYGVTARAFSNVNVQGFHPILTNNTQLFHRSSLSGAVHFGVEYAITPRVSLRATPSFSYMLTKMNQSSNRSTHGFWGGLEVGLRFFLN